jgi:hypothetical protein
MNKKFMSNKKLVCLVKKISKNISLTLFSKKKIKKNSTCEVILFINSKQIYFIFLINNKMKDFFYNFT